MTSKVVYNGELRTVMTHLASGDQVVTDAPTDNHGKGEAFSPTDLMSTALASCLLTVTAIKANQMGLNMDGATASVNKIMSAELPRRVACIEVNVVMPANSFTQKDRTILENTARTCPVSLSLHPDLVQKIAFEWPTEA
jgi:putative redox protein